MHAGIELWMVDIESRQAERLVGPRLNLAAGNAPRWLSDNQRILVALVPGNRGPVPEKSPVPNGPTTQENMGKTAPARTYQDLLKNEHDESLYDHYFTAQIGIVDVQGKLKEIGYAGPLVIEREAGEDRLGDIARAKELLEGLC